MNAAQYVVGKFGSQTELAKLLGKRQSTVQYWTDTGRIPARYQPEILRLAEERGVDVVPGDFVRPDESDPNDDTTLAPLPVAEWPGVLPIGDMELEVYVLSDGRRVISRTGAARMLVGRQAGGHLVRYVSRDVHRFVPDDWTDQFFPFLIPGVANRTVLGMPAETFLDLCQAYAQAAAAGALVTPQQRLAASRASAFLAACAKVGIIALIDEATGFQYEREQNALQFKLKLYLAEEMRKWEKTFPDALWLEFARLTRWGGPLNQRPKYWGNLVTELVYEYLDPDVAKWLKEHVPHPQHGQNHHQYLSGEYGLRKLMEHIWMLVGMARASYSIRDLKQKMAEHYGRSPIQLTLWVPPAGVSRAAHQPGGTGEVRQAELLSAELS